MFSLQIFWVVAVQNLSVEHAAVAFRPSFNRRNSSRFHGVRYGRSDFSLQQFFATTEQASDDDNDERLSTTEKVEVGSTEYLEGFLSSPIQDLTVAERGNGLEQALKLGGGVAIVLILLVFGFLFSNGLI
ncbi:hypothetical protein IV203_034678 [Nitzschia inconspicua]|uniref:Uncharacterized protein n=1 Tax=Nitzschia inconspicua TaxID=303405 RepID=A0A9K3LD47_9STRA|nr:hypothetical protein IV203_034678 [Nitzschia inconspicua]